MKKRIFTFILTLITVVSMLPISAMADDDARTRSSIIEQADAYADSLNQSNAHNAAVSQLLMQSLYHPNENLALGEGDAFTASMMNSALYRSFLKDALTTGILYLQSSGTEQLIIGSTTLGWHDYDYTYNLVRWSNDTADPKTEPFAQFFTQYISFTEPLNQNDTAMEMVVGSAGSYMYITQTDPDVPVYHVDLIAYDSFDFNADYSDEDDLGFDTSNSALITLIGGKYLNPFSWELTLSFDITLSSNPFTDVTEMDWFYAPVLWAVEQGVTTGKTDTTFAPNDPCTRAQVVTFLWAAAGKPEPASSANPFTDVQSSDWYYKSVLWAAEQGITGGFSDGSFRPNDPCTRAQVVTFLYAAAGKPDVVGSSTFADVSDSAWYAVPVIWAVENDVTSGIGDGKFGPDDACTRAQVVTFLKKASHGWL